MPLLRARARSDLVNFWFTESMRVSRRAVDPTCVMLPRRIKSDHYNSS